MIHLFFDIETIPVEKNRRDEVEAITKKPYEQTSLNGNFGRIFCIGYIKEPPKIEKASIIKGSEKEILTEFWQLARDVDLFIGQNVMDFDLRFIYKRSVIHDIKPTRELSFARYRQEPIYDTMREWEKWTTGNYTSLDVLAKIFGFPTSKDKMDGSMVYDFYLKKRYDEIYHYCQKDVELTRKIYYKMNFLQL